MFLIEPFVIGWPTSNILLLLTPVLTCSINKRIDLVGRRDLSITENLS